MTILFTDLVGSTDLLSRAGDEDAQRILRAHHQLLAETAAAHGGAEVKWLGDGLMVAFGSASDALRCAIAMQQASRRPVAGERLAIRVGLNAGEALRDEADYFVTPVVVARRLVDGEIVRKADGERRRRKGNPWIAHFPKTSSIYQAKSLACVSTLSTELLFTNNQF
ncbi:MAG TPA: adenylate/guanylate cyclase domain-containing protein [Acidimicrobiia bacterium]|nr:adenylate/guanylate cyclase domain-containing protein [Acidimicrobiia bacterium]